jgi:ubiquinone/menaquinone biosynthesis C-methylase UbiE
MRFNICMAKTERELAFIRDLYINESWTRRFTDLIDKHIGFKDAENILYINAGTGDHCIALREKIDANTALFATCENEEILKIARDKAAATRTDVDFSMLHFEDDSFEAVLTDASFTNPAEIRDAVAEAVRVARPGASVAIALPAAGSFGEVFSLLWEVLFNEDLGEHGAAAEAMVAELPSISAIEEIAAEAGLSEIETNSTNEIFEYENGAEFVGSPLVSDFLLPVWLKTLNEKEKKRVVEKLAHLIDAEDGSLTFRFTVKVTLITGTKN